MRLTCSLAAIVVLVAVTAPTVATQSEAIPSDLFIKLERTATATRIGFSELRDSYRAMITDLPTTFVTITANGRTKKIEDYFGAPRALKQLEIQIDEITRTQRWLRKEAHQAPGVRPQAAACTTDDDLASLNRFVGEVTRDFRQEQARYDRETKHGVFLFGQGKWESRVKAALRK